MKKLILGTSLFICVSGQIDPTESIVVPPEIKNCTNMFNDVSEEEKALYKKEERIMWDNLTSPVQKLQKLENAVKAYFARKSIPVYRTRDLAYTVFEGYILTDVSRYNSAKVKDLLANGRQYNETAIWRKVEQFETLYRAMFHWWSYDGVRLYLKAFRLSMAREKFYLGTYDETMALFDAAHKCFVKAAQKKAIEYMKTATTARPKPWNPMIKFIIPG